MPDFTLKEVADKLIITKNAVKGRIRRYGDRIYKDADGFLRVPEEAACAAAASAANADAAV